MRKYKVLRGFYLIFMQAPSDKYVPEQLLADAQESIASLTQEKALWEREKMELEKLHAAEKLHLKADPPRSEAET